MNLSDQSRIEFLNLLDQIEKSPGLKERSALIARVREKIFNHKNPEKVLWPSPFRNRTAMVLLLFSVIASSLKLMIGGPIKTVEPCKSVAYDPWDLGIYIFWVVAPPIFFLIEYAFCFGRDPSNRLDPEQTADLKYVQELGSKIWAAIIVGFGVLLLVRYKLELP